MVMKMPYGREEITWEVFVVGVICLAYVGVARFGSEDSVEQAGAKLCQAQHNFG